jgi:hypothetical protein
MKKTTKINIGDLFVRERTRTHIIIVFYISGIHISGQYKLEYIGNDPNNKFKHQYYEEQTLLSWINNKMYQHFPVKE